MFSTAARRSAADLRVYTRAAVPSMKPSSTPGFPSGGVLSNVIRTGDASLTACPVSPASRQNGVSYTASHLITEPLGNRCVSWSRRAGSAGWYSSRPASDGAIATITRLPRATSPASENTRTPLRDCSIRRAAAPRITRFPSRFAIRIDTS